MLLAKDIMTREVITVELSASVRELSKLLTERRITGVPVVDSEQRLVGMVSMRDLIREQVLALGATPEYHEISELFSSALYTEESEGMSYKHLWVEEIMSRDLHTAEESTPIREICDIMCAYRLHRVPILRNGKVIGIVTATDIIRAISEGKQIG
ncbi:MAG: hypothetical protein Kow0099_02260 [Candidatus Abyssubacteria bacterium]